MRLFRSLMNEIGVAVLLFWVIIQNKDRVFFNEKQSNSNCNLL